MQASEAYDRLAAHSRESALLGSALSLLYWDQRTMIPPAGQAGRAEQVAALTGVLHRRATDPRIGEWLGAVEAAPGAFDPDGPGMANIRGWRRDYDLSVKVPLKLATALALAGSEGQTAWEAARAADDFRAFAPHLSRLLDLSRQKAEALGYAAEPYDALLDLFEPGETAASLVPIFAQLRAATADIPALTAGRPEAGPDLPAGPYPPEDQAALDREVAVALGLPLSASRLDTSVHPFSTLIGPGDARVTVRHDPADFTKSLFSAIHETGHALYSLGHSGRHWGAPMGEAVSLGVHESQSRLWENFVARSEAFWEFFLPRAKARFPVLAGVGPKTVFRAVNRVRPGLIRVDADEVTYNLHVLLRFELELALFRDELQVPDLPEAWREKSRELLGVVPPSEATGVLQDVHWSGGAFGYFPTYTLGNVYAAMLFEAAGEALGDLAEMFRRGRFEPLLSWLRENVHRHGRAYPPRELIRRATGRELTAEPLLAHLRGKFGRG